jgi:hypothetical protein
MLTKSNKDIAHVEDTRPIVVLSHITKIIEKAIVNKLKELDSQLFKVKGYQTGFKEGKSTSLNLTKLLTHINDTRRKRTQRSGYLFVDLKKAYDSVDRNKLFQILLNRATNNEERKIIYLIWDLFYRNTILFDNTKINVEKGVP